MSEQRCPDCGVTMETTELITTGESRSVQLKTDHKRDGFLGTIGVKQKLGIDAYLCPECGMVRLYADMEDESGF